MVRIMSEPCDCGTCDGGKPAFPIGSFGSSKCLCRCHFLTGKEREEFLNKQKQYKFLSKEGE